MYSEGGEKLHHFRGERSTRVRPYARYASVTTPAMMAAPLAAMATP